MINEKFPRIALVHDYLKEYGGAETVLEVLSEIFPQADIYTSLYRPSFFGPHRDRLEKKWQGRVHQSWFGYLPLAHKLLSPFRFLSPLAFGSFDFSHYDIIITSATGAFFPNSLNKKSAKLICYCHTPPRYLYGLSTGRSIDTPFYRLVNPLLQLLLHLYRFFDFRFSQNVDQYLANSRTTASRIQKYYRRDSIIIHPPVDIHPSVEISTSKAPALPALLARRTGGSREGGRRPEGFFLTGGRLTHAKRYDVAIAACQQLGLPLKIFGRGFADYESRLRQLAGPHTEFLGEVSQSEKWQLFASATAYIFPSDNEDFGIVAVEAQSQGCPVIGYNSGGITETVIDGKTGYLFDNLTPESCAAAIQKLLAHPLKPSDCVSRSRQFSIAAFTHQVRSLVSSY